MGDLTETSTDVLVIGGGMAGTRAALEAAKNNVSVTMVMKTGIGKGGATGPYWYGGLSLPTGDTDPDDSPKEMFNDIMYAAQGVCNEKLARILSIEILDRYDDLERWGFNPPNKVNGKFKQHEACFSRRPRAITMFGFEPSAIEVLGQQVRKNDITIRDDIAIVSLLKRNDDCVGALGVDKSGSFISIKSKSTILTTGGAAGIFPPRYDANAVGAGYSMGYRIGAELINMEFIQMFAELSSDFPIIPYFLNPVMTNSRGESFLNKYLPENLSLEDCLYTRMRHVPFSSSDDGKYADIAIYKELLETHPDEKGRVIFDFTGINKEEALRKAEEIGLLHMFGPVMDFILSKPQTIRPHGHAFNGGLKINEKAETGVPGLYAAGETAGGPHGADRLGGNMIAAAMVFGKRAGENAAIRAKNISDANTDKSQLNKVYERFQNLLTNSGTIGVGEIERKIRSLMWKNCLIVKNQKGLEKSIEELKRIKNEDFPEMSVKGKNEVFRAVSIPSMIETARLVLYAVEQRKESRGGHYREDFPEKDDVNWKKIIEIQSGCLNLDE